MKSLKYLYSFFSIAFGFLLPACTLTGPSGIFSKKSPHELYAQKLVNAGLKRTALGSLWFSEAENSLNKPLSVTIPYREAGYFSSERPRAVSIQFETKRGQKLSVTLQKRPAANFTIYVDIWEVKSEKNKRLVAYADTNASPFSFDIDDEGLYLLRLQPELLGAGEYTLTISVGPSLAFPVTKGNMGSFWGASRDEGARKHEGVDIFAPRRTPAIAAADGLITRVGENNLGGKVVFMRPNGKNYNLYYAHLDEQLVSDGQKVNEGDTIGLIGNTGNAIHTSPHLHFGVYAFGGAVDPLPFVSPEVKKAQPVSVALSTLGKSLRTTHRVVSLKEGPSAGSKEIASLPLNTLVLAEGATTNWYKVLLPDHTSGFVNSAVLGDLRTPVRSVVLISDSELLDRPSPDAARKTVLSAGTTLKILGIFNGFYFMNDEQNNGWIEEKHLQTSVRLLE